MAWVYLDDKFPRHPKILGAMQLSQHAPWLFICGLAYCREHLTGGLMPSLVIPTLTPLYKPAMRDALVTVGLWEGTGDWIQIHDYADWNATEDDQREKRSVKARRGAQAKWGAGSDAKQTRSERLAAARKIATHTEEEWNRLVDACGQQCPRCTQPFSPERPWVKDHIIPIYQGGSDGINNLQPLCKPCNSSKGAERQDFRPLHLVKHFGVPA